MNQKPIDETNTIAVFLWQLFGKFEIIYTGLSMVFTLSDVQP